MADCGFHFDTAISKSMKHEEGEKIISKTRVLQV
jgi:hypothetical protein